MRVRALIAVATAVLVGAATQASAKIDTLDGKKVKKVISITQTRQNAATVGDPDEAKVIGCRQGIDCNRLDFIYKPAKGVKGNITVFAQWYFVGTTDVDIYLVGAGKVLGKCGGEMGNERHFDVAASALKPGKAYTAIAWYSHSTGEGLTLEVDMPTKTVKPYEAQGSPAPAPVPSSVPPIPNTVRVDGACS
ncbi:MAG: hypothetical protein QOK42_1323 [Frankiaceae bacterium]|jgi:hypothetical protein|nr:hypothetical protein [Frankiaceae bacterium]MDX6224654.1 hypothetical protein [Frankiales bacterium]MDX6273718.1 hypothetical protein [Frankiales bacterium]